jgi:pyrroloquinoline-quinone synthase
MMSRKGFLEALHQVGQGKYHHLHPFHQRMNAGELSAQAIRTWVTNRFYYQKNIPLKDAAILSNCPSREVRRIWLHRIIDHDGQKGDEGGIAAWLRLAEACGVDRDELEADRRLRIHTKRWRLRLSGATALTCRLPPSKPSTSNVMFSGVYWMQ